MPVCYPKPAEAGSEPVLTGLGIRRRIHSAAAFGEHPGSGRPALKCRSAIQNPLKRVRNRFQPVWVVRRADSFGGGIRRQHPGSTAQVLLAGSGKGIGGFGDLCQAVPGEALAGCLRRLHAHPPAALVILQQRQHRRDKSPFVTPEGISTPAADASTPWGASVSATCPTASPTTGMPAAADPSSLTGHLVRLISVSSKG